VSAASPSNDLPHDAPASRPTLFRAVVPVADIALGLGFYRHVLAIESEQVGPGRHYFHCGQTVLVCLDADAEGHEDMPRGPNRGHLYFAVDDLDDCHARASDAGCLWLEPAPRERAWGERSFYARDPFDNPLCFVARTTRYT
jgi:catechol 2,3-dioxygenase-like lactoylglutathione lyase family enzyme